MNIMTIAVIGDLSSGKETLVKYFESKGYKSLLNIKEDEENSNSISKFEFEDVKKCLDENSNLIQISESPKSKSSLKLKLKHMAEEKIIIYPYLDYKDYLELKSRTSFRLINLTSPTEKRFNNFLNKHKNSTIEDFFKLDSDIQKQSNFSKMRLESFCHIENNSNLEEFEEKLGKMFVDIKEYLRPSWNDYFMSIAHILANRSNCVKQKVGAVIVKDKRIISTGYNGTPSKIKNCFLGGCLRCNDLSVLQGQGLDCCFCLHAEENAVLEVGRVMCLNATLYTTVYPCLMCAKIIVECGISKIIYDKEYNSILTADIFNQSNMQLFKWSPQIKKFY